MEINDAIELDDKIFEKVDSDRYRVKTSWLLENKNMI